MSPELRQLAAIAREHADTARSLANLCLEITDSLEAVAEAILREQQQASP